MFFPLWRRLWSRGPGLSRGQCRRGGQHISYRPRLEPLEDRLLPAPSSGWVPSLTAGASPAPPQVGAAPAGAVSSLQPLGYPPLGYAGQLKVTVFENSPATVINLNTVFAGVSGLQHKDGLQMSLMGNTNPGLVRTDLSKAELTLNYARGQSGTATIIVAATDADGVCVKESILVAVLPLLHRPGAGGLSTLPTAGTAPTTART
jgi:hypothetical protein